MNASIERFAVDDKKRLEGIGGSEVGSAMDVNSFCSAAKLYKIKVGELVDDVSSDAADLGHILEPWILDKYEQKEGIKLERPGDRVYRHPIYPWLFAHVDGLVIGQKKGVDAKSTGLMNWQAAKGFGKAGTDEVPKSIICQGVLYMAIFDYDQWDIAALVAGGGVRFYQIYRDLELEKIVIDKLKYFWFENVQKRNPPEAKSVEDADVLYTSGNLDPIESTPDIYQKYLERFKIQKRIAIAIKELGEIDFDLKKFMGDHSELVNFAEDPLITWYKDQDSEKFDKDSFKAEHSDLYKQYLVPKIGGRRFLPKKL